MQVKLRSSQIAIADNCRRMLQYQYILRVQSVATSANLAFGRCVDVATREYLESLTLGAALPDPVARFQALWEQETSRNILVYSVTQNPEAFARMGSDLLQIMPECWDSTGFQVALDADVNPMLDVHLSCYLGRHAGIDVFLEGTIDVVAYTDDSDLAVIDVKSAASEHTPLYTARSDQLTTYQILVSANRQQLGLPPLRKLGFWDFLKRRASSRIEPPLLVPVRGEQELKEFRDKCYWIAEDIARGRFPRVSRMQFNSPCEMCDYAQHCVYGETHELVFPASALEKIA